MKKAMVIGSSVIDVTIRVDHLPKVEEDVNPYGQKLSMGGCSYNVGKILRQLSVPMTQCSPVGRGFYGQMVAEGLRKEGVEPWVRPEEENGCCYCIVDQEGNRTFLAIHGAEYHFQKAWLDAMDASEYQCAYCCGLEIEEDTGEAIVSYMEEHPELLLYYAPGARILNIDRERQNRLLAIHPILHLNHREAYSFLAREGLIIPSENTLKCCCRLLEEITGNLVIITDGRYGSACMESDGSYHEAPAFPAVHIDGNGAGDSHIGAFIAGRMLGLDVDHALSFASRISALAVGQHGASIPDELVKEAAKEMIG